MKALITGHRGYIGSHLVEELLIKGHDIAGLDLKGCDISANQLPGEDLCEGVPIEFYEYSPDIIFHLAAIPRVEYSVEKPVEVMKNNVISTSKILKFANRLKVPVIYSSSSSFVGNNNAPESPYALSKYVGELEALLYYRLYGVKTVALRYFNVYSSDQVADSAYATVIPNWKKHIETPGQVPFITGTGDQRRDMTHVKDIVSANIFCAENIEKEDLWGEWYDIGSGENISLNEIKEIVLKYFPNQKFDYVPPRPGDVMSTQANLAKFKKHGWKSEVSLHHGLEEVFEIFSKEIKS